MVGLDIGGTNSKIGMVTRTGELLIHGSFPSQAEGTFEDFLRECKAYFEDLCSQLPPDIAVLGVGIGAPDANQFTGHMRHPVNFKWGEEIPLVEGIRDTLDIPAIVANDANAAAVGEWLFGDARSLKDFIIVTLGTGVGGGIYTNGELLLGKNSLAGEIGHMVSVPNGRKCNCGRNGCLETYASATGLTRTALEWLPKYPKSILHEVPKGHLTSAHITHAAAKGDQLALEALEYTGEILGRRLADLVACFNPEAIILSGGLVAAGDWLLRPVKEHYEKELLPLFKDTCQIMVSRVHTANAAVLGAAAMAWREFGR